MGLNSVATSGVVNFSDFYGSLATRTGLQFKALHVFLKDGAYYALDFDLRESSLEQLSRSCSMKLKGIGEEGLLPVSDESLWREWFDAPLVHFDQRFPLTTLRRAVVFLIVRGAQ
jgi:hypothetical protein